MNKYAHQPIGWFDIVSEAGINSIAIIQLTSDVFKEMSL